MFKSEYEIIDNKMPFIVKYKCGLWYKRDSSQNFTSQVIRINPSKQLPSKDADALKLFIGQIPKHFDEDEIRPIFEKYGEIYEIVILKDRATGVSRGGLLQ